MLRGMAWLLAAIPPPPTNGLHLGPFTVHVYGLCYASRCIAAVAITRRRWVAQGGSRELVYDVALWGFPAGLVGGRLYYLATTPATPSSTGGDRWRSGRGDWGSGAASRSARSSASGASGEQERTSRPSSTRPRLRCWSRRPSDASATTSTRSCSGARPTCHGPWRSTRTIGPRATSPTPTFHPTFLYERVELDRGRHGLAGTPPHHPAAGPVRPLHRRLLRLSDRRRTAARRPRCSRDLRGSLEPASRRRRHARRARLVRSDPARRASIAAGSRGPGSQVAVSSAGGRVACTAACPWRRHPFAQCGPLRRV